MALNTKPPGRWWSRLHFLVRFAGLTGLVGCGVGVALAFLNDVLDWQALSSWEFVRSTLTDDAGGLLKRLAVGLLLGGGLLALLALLVEGLVILARAAGRRSAFGFNAALQIVLALTLAAGINYYSYQHYIRYDWTRDRQFTLPAEVQSQLSQLSRTPEGKTTVVVYQRHKTFGQLADKPDAYDFAAERKVVEKVKDLVDQFREFGHRFRVEVLDVEEEGYNEHLEQLTKDAKELREAIDGAPENSIFFHANGKVQRLSFNDFYQLDKTASRQADGKRGNLVLLYQGVEPFARKVLNIDEKRPKVGMLVVHEWLTTEGPEEFGFGGLKKALAARGFDVRDVILKKWSEMAPPEPAVYTYEESKLDRLEEQLAEEDADIKNVQEELKNLSEVQELWKKALLDELNKKYAKELGGRKVDEALRRRQLAFLEQNAGLLRVVLGQYREEREATAKEKAALSLNAEQIAEQRRIPDLKAKLDRSLADCDLLLIPRMTIRNVMVGDRIPNQVHRLDEAQVASIKDFLKSGKPVLACFGPSNEHPNDRMRFAQMAPPGPDELEELFAKLGIKFANQTVLYNVESKSFAERRSGLLVSGVSVEVPPVEFEKVESARPLAKPDAPARKANPIRAGMRIAAHSRGNNLDLRVRYPRPVYYEPHAGETPPFEPEFMMTSSACWNEDQPFPTRERTPRFEPPKADDPAKGTLDEKRRGPFPIGVAVQTSLPSDWYADKGARRDKVRVAAIGQGSLFTGPELSPAKEELLLDTCNWLLGRDDLLPRDEHVWAYPRVSLDPKAHAVWHWGTWLGLPGLFAYLGLVVLMVRRLR